MKIFYLDFQFEYANLVYFSQLNSTLLEDLSLGQFSIDKSMNQCVLYNVQSE